MGRREWKHVGSRWVPSENVLEPNAPAAIEEVMKSLELLLSRAGELGVTISVKERASSTKYHPLWLSRVAFSVDEETDQDFDSCKEN